MDGDRHHFCRNFSHQPVDCLFHSAPFFSALSGAFPRAGTLHGGMTPPFCNVALAVPLRTTFTYAVPEAMQGTVQPGSRVLVPFRKKAMVGVVVELVESAPPGTKIREITRVLDFVPALTPKLIELAQWIAGYYLAPIGELFRAMLPPLTELKIQREIVLTPYGRDAVESLGGGEISHGLSPAERVFLEKVRAKNGPAPFSLSAKHGIDAAAIQRLQHRKLIEIRESLLGKKRKLQTVVAWKGL